MILLEHELSSLAKIGDGAHASLKRINKGIPYLTAKNISKSGIDYKNINYISEKIYNQYFKDTSNALTQPKKDDILYSIIGSIGGVYVVRDERIGISSSIAILRADKSIILPEYLAYYMNGPIFDANIQAVRGGVAQGFMSLAKLGSIIIKYPEDINYQKKIVDILSTYDNLIENNQKQIKLLEEAAQRLYKEWFIDLRFPGHENVEIVDGIPEGWNIRPFNEVFSYVRGKSYKSSELSESEGVLLVNLKNINAFGGYKRNAEKRYIGTYKADQRLDAGDIVMGVTDMTQERRLVGHVAIVPDLGENMTFSMDLIKLIPKAVTGSYLYSAMRFGRYSEQISPFANGVNVLHLKPEAIMNMIMVVPSKDVLEQYENIFESYRKKIELLEKLSNYLTEARDRLLPKLMSMEIEV